MCRGGEVTPEGVNGVVHVNLHGGPSGFKHGGRGAAQPGREPPPSGGRARGPEHHRLEHVEPSGDR
eukprot:10920382-Lingulodinium_polyedra.AAC.1